MKTKKIISIISLALIVALMVIACVGCTAFDDLKTKVEKALDGVVATDENGNAMTDGGSYDMPKEMTFIGLKMVDADPGSTASVSITATLTPATVTDPTVDWTLAWSNASSSWASGKTVTDYVTVTPTSDGALTATVTNIQPFGERVILTCTARSNSSATATCTIKYVKRVSSCTITANNGSSNVNTIALDQNITTYTFTASNPSWGVGTETPSSTPVVEWQFSSSYLAALKDAASTTGLKNAIENHSSFAYRTGTFRFSVDDMLTYMGYYTNNENLYGARYDDMVHALAACTNMQMINVRATYGSGSTASTQYRFINSASTQTIYVAASSAALSLNTIEF